MVRELTCIVCPRGCALRVEIEEGKDLIVTGNACPRGVQYAIDECTHPMRTLTGTVLADDGRPIPVKTDRTIPKELLLPAMQDLASFRATLPVHIGDVLIEHLLGTDARIVVTANVDNS